MRTKKMSNAYKDKVVASWAPGRRRTALAPILFFQKSCCMPLATQGAGPDVHRGGARGNLPTLRTVSSVASLREMALPYHCNDLPLQK